MKNNVEHSLIDCKEIKLHTLLLFLVSKKQKKMRGATASAMCASRDIICSYGHVAYCIHIYIYIYYIYIYRERERERNDTCPHKQRMSSDAHMTATVAPHVFAVWLQGMRTLTIQTFPFFVWDIRKKR